jgi:hypothetical protein
MRMRYAYAVCVCGTPTYHLITLSTPTRVFTRFKAFYYRYQAHYFVQGCTRVFTRFKAFSRVRYCILCVCGTPTYHLITLSTPTRVFTRFKAFSRVRYCILPLSSTLFCSRLHACFHAFQGVFTREVLYLMRMRYAHVSPYLYC